jgi:hypothetical protein
LVWFERRNKHEQDCILLEWYKYATSGNWLQHRYRLPYDASGIDVESPVRKEMKSHQVCSSGIRQLMHIGKKRMVNIGKMAGTTGVMPLHKLAGRKSNNAIADDDERGKTLTEHFEYLLELGEVRATRVIATLVDGVQGHANRDDTVDMVYLPISMGYRNCYQRYMSRLGYNVSCKPNGSIVVEVSEGEDDNPNEYVSFSTYCSKWKKDYPQLKVSRPVEDICQYCYVFALCPSTQVSSKPFIDRYMH